MVRRTLCRAAQGCARATQPRYAVGTCGEARGLGSLLVDRRRFFTGCCWGRSGQRIAAGSRSHDDRFMRPIYVVDLYDRFIGWSIYVVDLCGRFVQLIYSSKKYMPSVSTTHAGLRSPSTSILTSEVSSSAPARSLACSTVARARTREPAATGV